MSISTTESLDSAHSLDALNYYSDQLERSKRHIYSEFMAAVRKHDLTAPAPFAPLMYDFRQPAQPNGLKTKRLQTVAEVMRESVDYGQSPSFEDLLLLVLDCARGKEMRLKAETLIQRMAWAFADMNAEVNE